jgi:hypothetical protein
VAAGVAAGSTPDSGLRAGRPQRCRVGRCAAPRGVAVAVVAAPVRTAAAAVRLASAPVATHVAIARLVAPCAAAKWSAAVGIGVVRAVVIGTGGAMRALVLNRPRQWSSEWLADRPPDRPPERRLGRAAARRLAWLLGWPLDPPRTGSVVAARALGALRHALTRAPMRLPMCALIHALARRRRRAHRCPQARATAGGPQRGRLGHAV